MATAPTSNVVRPLDPFKTARIPVRMSARVTPSSHHEGGSFSAVKFNHKPSQVSVTRKTRLRTSIDECRLVINDYDQGSQQPNASYEYKGVKRSTSNMYALIVSEDRQSLILEPVDSEYLFNLTTAPWEKDSSKLASAYPQLELAMHDKAENTGGEKRDSHEGDGAFNPFDYRHYLEPSPPSSPEVAQRSVVASPFGFPDASPQHLRVPSPRPAIPTPGTPQHRPKIAAPKPRRAQQSVLLHKSPRAAKKQRLDKAVGRSPLGMTPTQTSPEKSASEEPISFASYDRSVENSPAIFKTEAPKPKARERKNSYEIDFGELGFSGRDEDDADADIDEMKLPSPVKPGIPRLDRQQEKDGSAAVGDDEDDDEAEDEDASEEEDIDLRANAERKRMGIAGDTEPDDEDLAEEGDEVERLEDVPDIEVDDFEAELRRQLEQGVDEELEEKEQEVVPQESEEESEEE